jgi:hypothetical protein
MTETEAFDYKIDNRTVIIFLFLNHVLYIIPFSTQEETFWRDKTMLPLHWSASIHVNSGTSSLTLTIFCDKYMPF